MYLTAYLTAKDVELCMIVDVRHLEFDKAYTCSSIASYRCFLRSLSHASFSAMLRSCVPKPKG